MTTKEYKIVLAGEFGSGKSTFASRSVSGKDGKAKIGELLPSFLAGSDFW
jgi:GTPase SAR1 family protein